MNTLLLGEEASIARRMTLLGGKERPLPVMYHVRLGRVQLIPLFRLAVRVFRKGALPAILMQRRLNRFAD